MFYIYLHSYNSESEIVYLYLLKFSKLSLKTCLCNWLLINFRKWKWKWRRLNLLILKVAFLCVMSIVEPTKWWSGDFKWRITAMTLVIHKLVIVRSPHWFVCDQIHATDYYACSRCQYQRINHPGDWICTETPWQVKVKGQPFGGL